MIIKVTKHYYNQTKNVLKRIFEWIEKYVDNKENPLLLRSLLITISIAVIISTLFATLFAIFKLVTFVHGLFGSLVSIPIIVFLIAWVMFSCMLLDD